MCRNDTCNLSEDPFFRIDGSHLDIWRVRFQRPVLPFTFVSSSWLRSRINGRLGGDYLSLNFDDGLARRCQPAYTHDRQQKRAGDSFQSIVILKIESGIWAISIVYVHQSPTKNRLVQVVVSEGS